MMTISHEDLSSLAQFLQEAAAPGDLSTYASRLLPVIHGLVPGDVLCFAQVDPVNAKVVTQVAYAPGGDVPCDSRVFERFMMAHPVFQHWATTGQSSAARTSDFLRPTEWHRYDLYHEFYKDWRCEDSLAIGLPSPPGLVACFCIERASNFTDREMMLMETIRPHLASTYRNSEAFTLLGQAAGDGGGEWLLLDAQGRPAVASHAAWDLLWAYFPDAPRRRDALPERLASLVTDGFGRFGPDHELPPLERPVVRTREDGSTLTIRLLWGPTTGEQAALVLRETAANTGPEYPYSRLTERELEVLEQARRGTTAAEIGDLLCISRRTVEKHLEHIYDKLDVGRRGEAVAKMFLS
jgi:DNA-binding CsgD family transcriptional regulator